jgi:thymidylate synthase (FAD)
MKDDFYVPEPEDIALQSEDNKQGRAPEPVAPGLAKDVIQRLEAGQRSAYSDYSGLVDEGLARELARINLPLSLYTEWYWQIDLHNLFRFLSLRLDPHAQKEIRAYAAVLFEIAKTVAPAACASFENHQLKGLRFSGEELAELRRRLAAADAVGTDAASSGTEKNEAPALSGKSLERFEEKLKTGRQL